MGRATKETQEKRTILGNASNGHGYERFRHALKIVRIRSSGYHGQNGIEEYGHAYERRKRIIVIICS